MKSLKNPEFRKELIIYIVLTAAAAIACLFIEPVCAGIALALGGSLIFLRGMYNRRRYEKIAQLSSQIDMILHGQEKAFSIKSAEGELAILESEISKMTIRLKEQSDQLMGDKQMLKEAIEDIFHQLRTPLTSMNLIISLLAQEELTYERRIELTRQLRKETERMGWQVETLLKMSRIDSGTAVFRKDSIKAADLLKEAVSPFLIPMELKEQTLKVDVSDESFTGDMSWTVEAVANLIKNCMEHTPQGGHIHINVSENALSTDIVITDSGSGFAKEDIPHLFERFYKGSNASEQSIGIGLALTRMIITSQNGTISASNAAHGGACFTVRFYKSIV